MKHLKILSVISAIALTAIALTMLPASAQDEAPPVDPNRFAGKVAVVYLRNMLVEDGILVRDAKLEKIQDRWFLTGESPDVGDPEDWMSGAEVSIEWARVESFHTLTEEHFQEHFVLEQEAPEEKL